MPRFWATAALLALPFTACKPPPTDADMVRDMPAAEPDAPSAPIDSPDSENALWVNSSTHQGRVIYGNIGEAPMFALTCEEDGADQIIRITRYAPADEGKGALLALIGNGHIARIEVDAAPAGDAFIWEGTVAADDAQLEVLTGRRGVTATLPGAGMIALNSSVLPSQLIEACRGDLATEDELVEEPAEQSNASTE